MALKKDFFKYSKKMLRNILIVDDDPSLRLALKSLLNKPYYSITVASGLKSAQLMAPSLKLDLAIVDLNLRDGSGVDLISSLKKEQPLLQSILITGEHSIHITIVTAIHKGIFYFIPKPFEPPAMLHLVKKVFQQKDLMDQNKNLKANIKKQFHFDQIIGQSQAILQLTESLRKIAKSSSNVLITGESGTGKELVARSIHSCKNSDKPFVSVNCGAIPKDLLESEFFGHRKGSFTGAVQHHRGYFSTAEDGSLFLDEIGAMDLSLQVKLLRVLQERAFRPVGGSEDLPVKARIIAATNVDLEKAVEKGEFREDLYYRLNIIPLFISPLRERRQDIPLLIQCFLKKMGKGKITLSDSALNCLCSCPWPGNIRELENLIERLCVFKEEGEISVQELPKKYIKKETQINPLKTIEIPNEGMDFNSAITACEDSLLTKALQKTNWNKRRAARLLNLNRTTLIEKIKKKGIKSPYDKDL